MTENNICDDERCLENIYKLTVEITELRKLLNNLDCLGRERQNGDSCIEIGEMFNVTALFCRVCQAHLRMRQMK
jgi:hypothetical protein